MFLVLHALIVFTSNHNLIFEERPQPIKGNYASHQQQLNTY